MNSPKEAIAILDNLSKVCYTIDATDSRGPFSHQEKKGLQRPRLSVAGRQGT